MRAVWIDAGNKPEGQVLSRHGVRTVAFAANDLTVSEALIDSWRRVFSVAIYRAQNWDDAAPDELADELSLDVQRLGGDTKQLWAHVDIELHDPAYMVAFLAEWRQRRSLRPTWWTLEGFQGGWFTPELLNAIRQDDHLALLPQAFEGDMTPLDPDGVRANLVNCGVPRSKVAVCYDAARLSEWWDGLAFTQGRLS